MFKIATVRFKKLQFSSIATFGLLVTSGCASVDDSISQAKLDSKTCTKLMSQGIDCQNNELLGNAPLAHAEYHQQLLPIHQRDDILNAELEELEHKN